MDCNKCKEATDFNAGLKGRNADITKLLFILNRSDSRALQPALFE